MLFRDQIYHLTPEGGEKLLQETHEQLDIAKSRLADISRQKARAMARYDAAIKEVRDEITGYMSVIRMVEEVVFGGEYSELRSNELSDAKIKQIINDDTVPF